MKRVLFVMAWFAAFVGAAGAEPPAAPLALKGLDPIALSEGKEVPGLESLESIHGRYRYRFANPENKTAFDAKPEERGIQFGGACGKMGPFSGNGNPDRFFVHDRRIYIFASESCRDGFKKNPDKHIEQPNPAPQGSEEQIKRGNALLQQVLAGFGGADKVDGIKNFQVIDKHVYKQGGKEVIGMHRVAWAFPNRVRIEEEFSVPYGFVVRGDAGFQVAGTEIWPLETSMRAVAWRQALRQPLALLRNRNAKGFIAAAKGESKVDDTPVELLAVALDGATSTWSIDPKTRRILQTAYQARRGTVGDNVVKFSDFREVNGLVLPHQRAVFFNGKAITSPEVRMERYIVNGDLKPDLFGPTQ